MEKVILKKRRHNRSVSGGVREERGYVIKRGKLIGRVTDSFTSTSYVGVFKIDRNSFRTSLFGVKFNLAREDRKSLFLYQQ
jgi:hypothetical protein